MDVQMRGEQAVPILITHRTVKDPPKIVKRRNFIGIREGLKALAIKTIEFLEDTFWETESKIEDNGSSSITHYALQIEDEGLGEEPQLVVTRLDGSARPASGAHIELIKMAKPSETMEPNTKEDSEEEPKGSAKALAKPFKRTRPKFLDSFRSDNEDT